MENPIISVVTTTFRREDLLARCAQSVLSQRVDARIEHIIVNDADEPLTHAPWMDDTRVQILNTHRAERCAARNAGVSRSRGDWLHFLDDDDYLLPGAFAALLAVATATRAAHVFGGYQTINEADGATDTIRPHVSSDVFPLLVAGEAFPTHATWIRRDAFLKAGGFDHSMIYAEDADLFRRVALRGRAAGTDTVVAVARIEHPTSTTDPGQRARKWHESTEGCLCLPETLPRLLESTRWSPYWRGRCAREYLASAGRNVVGHRLLRALDRLIGFTLLSAPRLARREFWRGLRRERSVLPLLQTAPGGTNRLPMRVMRECL